jgi:hypothetical protein
MEITFPTPRTGTKREVAMRVFREQLPLRKKLGDTPWRKATLKKIADEANTTHFAAVSFYNYEKKRAVHDGLTEDFARSALMSKRREEDEERFYIITLRKNAKTADGPFLLINNVTKETVGHFESSRKAHEVRFDGESVVMA